MSTTRISIFDYFDHVKYLRDCYQERHAAHNWFSYRYIQTKTGIDPGYLFKIFQGRKPVAARMVEPLAKTFGLNERETGYFRLMVEFGKAKTNEKIRLCFEKLLSYAEVRMRKVELKEYEYYTKWYYAAVRQILSYYSFKDDYRSLAAMTVPAISVAEAKNAVALLRRLGFVEESADGTLKVRDRFLTTGEQWHSIAVRKFQQDTIMLAGRALDEVPREQRDISTITISLSENGLQEVKERLRRFRHELLEIANREENAAGAYHLNLQLIPIGKRWSGGNR